MANEKKTYPAISSEVLQSIFEDGKSPLSLQFIRWKLWKKWSEYVGPTISTSSEPVGYYRGILYVWVKNATWMQQLVFMKDNIRDTVNKKLNMQYVTEIRFTMDRRNIPLAAKAEALREDMDRIQGTEE